MRFEEACGGWRERRLTQEEARKAGLPRGRGGDLPPSRTPPDRAAH